MASYIEMPKLSDTMTEGTLVAWRKNIGDPVAIGDVIAEIETDKAVMELEAFDEGTLGEIYIGPGGKARIGDKLAVLLRPNESTPPQAPTASKPAAAPAASHPPQKAAARPEEAPQPATGRVKASPLAKKMAAARGIDLARLRGSGPAGRIVARDVESAPGSAGAPAAGTAAPVSANGPVPAGASRRLPLSGMRKIIAERLLASKTQIPHFYLNIEVDAGPLVRLRAELNGHLEKNGQGKLTINDFVLKAAVEAAIKVPRVNASFAGDAVIEYADVHLAVAVAIDEGLVTPVVREAQKKSLRGISEAVKDLAARARTKKLKPEEYQGGTITVSNLGSYGIENFSAVINPPQAVILAIGAIVKKPVVDSRDQILIGHRMAVGLSADHRVVDGAIGAQYLAELRRALENPVSLLL